MNAIKINMAKKAFRYTRVYICKKYKGARKTLSTKNLMGFALMKSYLLRR